MLAWKCNVAPPGRRHLTWKCGTTLHGWRTLTHGSVEISDVTTPPSPNKNAAPINRGGAKRRSRKGMSIVNHDNSNLQTSPPTPNQKSKIRHLIPQIPNPISQISNLNSQISNPPIHDPHKLHPQTHNLPIYHIPIRQVPLSRLHTRYASTPMSASAPPIDATATQSPFPSATRCTKSPISPMATYLSSACFAPLT